MIAGIGDWILSLHGAAALAVVFAVPALEASAFVGFVFPGEIAVLLGGVLAYQHRVPLEGAMLAAVLGAVIGDNIGYVVGRRWGRRILHGVISRLPIVRHRVDEHLDSARAFVKRRGGTAVLVGRFTAALRVMVPGLAGMSEMPYGQFLLFNVVGGLLWGTAFVLLGFFGGAAWRRVATVASTAALGLLAAIVLAIVAVKLLRAVRAPGARRLPDRLASLRPAAWTRRRFPAAAAWLAGRVDPARPSGWPLTLVAVAGVAAAWTFAGLAQDVLANEEFVHLDPGVERWAVAHRVAWLIGGMKAVTWLGSSLVLVPLLVAFALFLRRRRGSWASGMYLLGAYAGALGLYNLAKLAVHRARPPAAHMLMPASGYSFPSGHATQAVAFYAMAAAVLSWGWTGRRRVAAWAVAVLVALLIGASRVYLGAHWLTDVLGGWALGAAWVAFLLGAALAWGAPANTRERDPVGEAGTTEPVG